MASRYKFSEEQIKEIEQARKDNQDKRVKARLKALELRAKGADAREVSTATGFHASSVTRLVAKYRGIKESKQLPAITTVAIAAI